MLIFGKERFIKAHQDVTRDYYNYSYDRVVKDAICNKCGMVIGEQVKYEIESEFSFDKDEKNNWKFCPYCGEQL